MTYIQNEIQKLAGVCEKNVIDKSLYTQYKVYQGLRDINGNGVLTGLTEISEIVAKKMVDGQSQPCRGELYYRGYKIEDLINGFSADDRYGFEEIIYLLLFGKLPSEDELQSFNAVLCELRTLPKSFVRDVIMKAPSNDVMNSMARSVLTLYSYDPDPNNLAISNVLRQCLQLIAQFPLLAIYGYQACSYYKLGNNSFFINDPDPSLSTAENLLHMLRKDNSYTKLEAQILDLCLVLHAEHGGGNNSSFTMHVVTSSGTDTYSAVASSMASLKGPKHGGANIQVRRMFRDIEENVSDWKDRDEVKAYLRKILDGTAFDRSGLIYGIGHAVYSISDPRADVLKALVQKLASAKGLHDEYELYTLVEELAPQVIGEKRKIYKGVSANVDFYSGYLYDLLGLPMELSTPIFAVARIAGWSAHRLEELLSAGKIIRPSYEAVQPHRDYVSLKGRKTIE